MVDETNPPAAPTPEKPKKEEYPLTNEAGLPNYPKLITDKDGKRVTVNSPDEEKKAGKPPKDDNKPAGWTK